MGRLLMLIAATTLTGLLTMRVDEAPRPAAIGLDFQSLDNMDDSMADKRAGFTSQQDEYFDRFWFSQLYSDPLNLTAGLTYEDFVEITNQTQALGRRYFSLFARCNQFACRWTHLVQNYMALMRTDVLIRKYLRSFKMLSHFYILTKCAFYASNPSLSLAFMYEDAFSFNSFCPKPCISEPCDHIEHALRGSCRNHKYAVLNTHFDCTCKRPHVWLDGKCSTVNITQPHADPSTFPNPMTNRQPPRSCDLNCNNGICEFNSVTNSSEW
jgi:hypothetical protein